MLDDVLYRSARWGGLVTLYRAGRFLPMTLKYETFFNCRTARVQRGLWHHGVVNFDIVATAGGRTSLLIGRYGKYR
jgi:hypothetical protein